MSWVEAAGDTIDFLYNLTKNERKLFRRLDNYYNKKKCDLHYGPSYDGYEVGL